ncbi:MAG: efflux RND transporter permease subunit [Chthoniobacteraceae bacterium]
MAQFFTDHPVFAWVVSILIALAGVLAITQLPIAQYPSVAPPSVSVSATYSGASAEIVQETVTSVIEQQLTGIDNLQYMTSSSSSSGDSTITLYFLPGTNADTAQVQVQNKVQLATPSLPSTVQQQGVTVKKAARNFMLICSFSSGDGKMDQYALGNYLAANVLDSIRRIPGVGEAQIFGSEYAMRIWLDPNKLNNYSLTAGDVNNAVSAQNTQVTVGQIGDQPAVTGQEINVTLKGQSPFKTAAEFENILLKVNTDGSTVRLKDVARVELGGQSYNMSTLSNGKPAATFSIKLSPSANALSTATAVKAKLNKLSEYFPHKIDIAYALDTSVFVRISIEEVVKTLLEAIVLVFLVCYLFLQNIRATLIPTIVIPVALLGTFASLYAFGFSINVLTMFGAVLAIGMLVDDAIVVVENVERIMSEEGLPPREATHKAMKQITGALIGITLVLTAVFIPMAFFSGSVGTIYRQFSVSIVSAMLLSVFLAMSLTPALCAAMLPPVEKGHKHEKKGFFGWFNREFLAMTNKYQGWVSGWIKRPVRSMLVYAVIIGALVFIYVRIPTAFLPEEDQGFYMINAQLPVGATTERTADVVKKVETFLKQQPEVETFVTIIGFSFNGNGQNNSLSFVRLKPWDERSGAKHSAKNLVDRTNMALSGIKDAMIFAMNPAPITELSMNSGFDLEIQDLGGLGHAKLMSARDQLIQMAAQDPRVSAVRVQGLDDEPQMKIQIDQQKASAQKITLSDLNTVLSTCFGSNYINNFTNENRVQRVIAQLDAPFRMKLDDVSKIFVRNSDGNMVPLSSFVSTQWTYGSPSLNRYNGFPSVEIVGSPAPGKSTGDAMTAMEEMVKKLPAGIGYEWTGQSYEERLSSSQVPILYGLSLVVVFLCLAALYESWSIPMAVLMVVPLGIVGALAATWLRDLSNDVYFKVGFLTIVGLSTKNAILIVEFAKEAQERGLGLIEATLQAVHLRLRPILMTSFAFILGVLPLAVAHGAGSASQNAIGTGVIGGMLTATVFALFLVPVFFVLVRRVFKGKAPIGSTAVEKQPVVS